MLLSTADLAELEETLSVLADPEALADIREADKAYARGDVVRGGDAVRALPVSATPEYEPVVTPPAVRAIAEQLPESVAGRSSRS